MVRTKSFRKTIGPHFGTAVGNHTAVVTGSSFDATCKIFAGNLYLHHAHWLHGDKYIYSHQFFFCGLLFGVSLILKFAIGILSKLYRFHQSRRLFCPILSITASANSLCAQFHLLKQTHLYRYH